MIGWPCTPSVAKADARIYNAGEEYEDDPDEISGKIFKLYGVWLCYREVGERMLRDGKGGSLIGIVSAYGLSRQQQGGRPITQARLA